MPVLSVKRGETLSSISRRFGVRVEDIAKQNRITDVDKIKVGQKITIPTTGLRAPTAPSRPQAPAMPTMSSAQTSVLTSVLTSGSGATLDGLADATADGDVGNFSAKVYAPGSASQVALFKEAARRAGLPESWASSPGLINILKKESAGQVGRPNYTYGARAKDPSAWPSIHAELKQGKKTTRSSATGLGQLLLPNVDKYYPDGRQGIGDPMNEAIGMLRYIKDRYRTPDNAWARYGKAHEGY